MTYIIQDIETTGLRTYNSRIVEVAAIVLGDDLKEIDRFESLVNPGAEALRLANPKAMAVNGLTSEVLKGAPCTDDASEALWTFLERHKRALIHSFNKNFDYWFLEKAPWSLPINRWGECIMMAAKDVMEGEEALVKREDGSMKFPSLREAAEFFNVKRAPSHRAISDCQTAADIYIEILRRRRSCPNEADLQREAWYIMGEGL